jgi:hypothetical protein
MSARAALNELFERTFAAASPVLWIGDKRLAPLGAVHVRDVSALQGSREEYAGIGWVTRSDVRAGLSVLRPYLRAGGALILVLDDAPLLGAVTRAFRLAAKPDSLPLIEAAEALLLLGFEEPCIVQSARPRIVLTGRKPAHATLLDAFFEQPTP